MVCLDLFMSLTSPSCPSVADVLSEAVLGILVIYISICIEGLGLEVLNFVDVKLIQRQKVKQSQLIGQFIMSGCILLD